MGVGFGTPIEATVTVQPRIVSTFQISANNLTNVVTTPQDVSIVIDRSGGTQIETQLNYNTTQPRQEVVIGKLQFQPALPHVHYSQIETSLSFLPGQTSRSISINVIAVDSPPAAFFVQIRSPLQ